MKTRIGLYLFLAIVVAALLPLGAAILTAKEPHWTWDDPNAQTDGWSCNQAEWVAEGFVGGGLACMRTPDHDGWRVELYYTGDMDDTPLVGDTVYFDIRSEYGVLPAICNSKALLEMAGVSRCAGARYPIDDLGNGWYRVHLHHPADLTVLDFNLFWRGVENDPGRVVFDNFGSR